MHARDDERADLARLRGAVEAWVALSEDQWSRFATLFRRREVGKGEHLLVPGERAYELLFVAAGLLRFYCADADGRESNQAFVAEGGFAAPLVASVLGLPVLHGIESLEPGRLLVARYSHFTALFDLDPVFDRLGRRLAEVILVRQELRTRSLLQLDARDRYLDFVQRSPELMGRIPQYHIASYLGITDVTASRVRRAIAEASDDSGTLRNGP